MPGRDPISTGLGLNGLLNHVLGDAERDACEYLAINLYSKPVDSFILSGELHGKHDCCAPFLALELRRGFKIGQVKTRRRLKPDPYGYGARVVA